MDGFLGDVEFVREELQISQNDFRNVVRWFLYVKQGRLVSWAYRWLATQFFLRTLSVVPCRNLVSNIGFDERAVHTKKRHPILSERRLEPMELPYQHPQKIENDVANNRQLFQIFFKGKQRKPWYRRWF